MEAIHAGDDQVTLFEVLNGFGGGEVLKMSIDYRIFVDCVHELFHHCDLRPANIPASAPKQAVHEIAPLPLRCAAD